MSKLYTDNLAPSNSHSPSGIEGNGVRGGGGGYGAHSLDHHLQGRRLPRQIGNQAQRQRPLRPSLSSECSWDLQLVGSPYAKRLRRKVLHLILGERDLAFNQARQSPSRGGGGDLAIPTSRVSSDGRVERSPLVIHFTC